MGFWDFGILGFWILDLGFGVWGLGFGVGLEQVYCTDSTLCCPFIFEILSALFLIGQDNVLSLQYLTVFDTRRLPAVSTSPLAGSGLSSRWCPSTLRGTRTKVLSLSKQPPEGREVSYTEIIIQSPNQPPVISTEQSDERSH